LEPERQSRVEQLVQEALELEARQQGEFLERHCAGDKSLRREVESLLAFGKDADNFMQASALQVAAQALATEDYAPQRREENGQVRSIGPYQLLTKLGEGGMGQVWLAEQTAPLQRRVALKLIRWGMYDDTLLHRFQAERQSLAVMDHPSIAKVFDAGATQEGQPYFVMEYVAGVVITDYCDLKKLKIHDRLELFVKVCEGVQHAHQKTIIHRDLKPANILVVEIDGKPVPRIIDFGLAKATNTGIGGESLHTRLGSFVGTPGYMSPEQCDPATQDVDTRTDVYSLGVVLYVLLAGNLPFDTHEWKNKPLDEMLRRLREEDPPRPSTKISTDRDTSSATAEARGTEPRQLVSVLSGDLDCITMKAVEKDRARRYSTPSDLAADIRRYLNNEAVLAVPPSPAYRARKLARRYRTALITACAFGLVLIAAAVIIIRQSMRANREAAVAAAVSDFLQNDLLAQASAATQSGPSAKPDPDLKVRTALDRAAERIEGKFAKQPDVEAAIRNTIGQTYTDLGIYRDAGKQLERALDLRRRVLGPEHPDTLKSMNSLAVVYWYGGKYPQAEDLHRQTLEIKRRVLGPEHPDTLRSMNGLAAVYVDEGKYPQAEALHSQTLEIRRRVLGPEHPDTLMSMNNLAVVYYYEGKYPQAEALDSQILEIRHQVLGPEHPNTLMSMHNLALVYNSEGKYPQAEALYNRTLEIQRRVLGPEHPGTLITMANLGLVYDSEGKYAQAEALDRQTLELKRRVLGPEHPDTLMSMNNLGVVYDDEGKYAQAEALDSQTLELKRRVLGPEHDATLRSMTNLALAYVDEGKYTQAEALDRQALEIQRHVLGPEHPDTLRSMNKLANIYNDEGKYTQAEDLHSQTLEIQRRVLRPDHPDTLMSMNNLAVDYQKQGKYALAEAYAGQALAGRRHALGPEHPNTMTSAADLALAYLSLRKYAQSELLARETMETDSKIQPDEWQRFRAESLLGASLAGQKKYVEAETLLLGGYRGMFARKSRIGAPDRYHLQLAHQWLVQLYKDWGKPQKAAEMAKELEP
jgi:eukaryotic-like serine/threonine-protein kinase